MRYFIYLSYKGTNYCGWQIQPNAPSVQETIELALETILREPCKITGAGRTDTGVHAQTMVIHLDLDKSLEEMQSLIFKLNRLLPKDIALHRVCAMTDDAHARFSAVARTYHYHINLVKNAFSQDSSLYVYHDLDFDKMNEAAQLLLETSDFTSFSKLHSDAKTNICKVTEAYWYPNPNVDQGYIFRITADRFLRNMVRAVVGTLLLVGRGKLTKEGFRKIINQQDRCQAGSSAEGYALYLQEIEYPREIFVE